VRALRWPFFRASTGDWKHDLRLGWWVSLWVFGIFGGLGLLVGGICGLVFWVSSVGCGNKGDRMGLAADYEPWSDTCYVQVGEAEIPVDQVRFTQDGVIVDTGE
jgi:hypothetical protein